MHCLSHHPGLPYPGMNGTHNALIARVDDVLGNITAAWRVYLTLDGQKLDCANPKLGIGPAGGGAVRIGGSASKIGVCEGIETGLAAWSLIGRKHPVWATLSSIRLGRI